MPLLPILTGSLKPCRSPLCGIGEPDFEILAPTTTSAGKVDSCTPDLAMESFSEKDAGKSFTCKRRVASGAFGPVLARAKIYRLSLGDALPAREGLNFTVPESVPEVAAPAAATDSGLFSAGGGVCPPEDCCCALATRLPFPDARDFASAMLALIEFTRSASDAGMSASSFSQYAAASLYFFCSNSAVPASARALGLPGSRRSALLISSSGCPSRLPLFVIATMSA